MLVRGAQAAPRHPPATPWSVYCLATGRARAQVVRSGVRHRCDSPQLVFAMPARALAGRRRWRPPDRPDWVVCAVHRVR